jgi:putative ABC transport system substrate-binding protein
MDRRAFILLLASSLVCPSVAMAQSQVRRVGILSSLSADDPEAKERNEAFLQALKDLGWVQGRNLEVDNRWADGDSGRLRTQAIELVAKSPDVLFATSGVSIGPLQQASTRIPIVFAQTIDPVGQGMVESLSRPGGNVTGFTQMEFGITGKWLELLKLISPDVRRVVVLRDTFDPAGIGQWGALQAAAPSFGLELRMINVRDIDAVEQGVAKLAVEKNIAILVTASAPAAVNRNRIMQLALQHRIPAIYPYAYFGRIGGLISYGPETIDQYRRAAGYVDRILKGEKAADLPVQAPTKYELIVNRKTASAIGIAIPQELLVRADEVID